MRLWAAQGRALSNHQSPITDHQSLFSVLCSLFSVHRKSPPGAEAPEGDLHFQPVKLVVLLDLGATVRRTTCRRAIVGCRLFLTAPLDRDPVGGNALLDEVLLDGLG